MGGRAPLGIILGGIIPCNCSSLTFASCSLIVEISSFPPRTPTLHDSPLVPRVPSSFPVSHRVVPSSLPPIAPFSTSTNLASHPIPLPSISPHPFLELFKLRGKIIVFIDSNGERGPARPQRYKLREAAHAPTPISQMLPAAAPGRRHAAWRR